jgi:hypothetical protein
MLRKGRNYSIIIPKESSAAAGNNSLLNSGPGGVQGVRHTVLLLVHLHLAGSADLEQFVLSSTCICRTVDAHNGRVMTQNGAVEDLWTSGRRFSITLMSSRTRIRIRRKVKRRIRIRIKFICVAYPVLFLILIRISKKMMLVTDLVPGSPTYIS